MRLTPSNSGSSHRAFVSDTDAAHTDSRQPTYALAIPGDSVRMWCAMNMGSGPRLILAIMAGLIVAICANVVLSETTGDDVTLAASLLLFMVTAVSFTWAFR